MATDTAGWKQNYNNTTVSLNARLISFEELNQIVPPTNTSMSSYCFHNGYSNAYSSVVIGANNYGWLFDNTSSCTNYGCNIEASNDGYWTSSNIIQHMLM